MRANPKVPVRRFNLVWLLWLALANGASGPAVAEAAAADGMQEAVLAVTVNTQPVNEMLIMLRDDSGALWLDAADFARLRLRLPTAAGQLRLGRRYLPLAGIPGIKIEVNETEQRLSLTAPATAFTATRLSASGRPITALAESSPGAFLNYELSAQHIADEQLTGGFAELGLFAARGVFMNSGLVRSLSARPQALRLDSTYTIDMPERVERLTIGDAIADGSTWGSAVRFAGIGWGSNFSLRPDLLTTPLLTATGTAVVPSTIDIYVNNQRVSSQALPPGPFIIDRLPAVTGAGQVSVVVRDALGREQQLSAPFYSSLRLLRAGLSQYQLGFGSVRRDYATASAHYGALLGSASYRRGISNALTIEGHGEFLNHGAHAVGLAGAAALGRFAVFNLTAAVGGAAGTSGSLFGVGLERQGARFNVVLSSSFAAPGYRQISTAAAPAGQYRRRDLAQLGANLQRWGSLSAAMIRESFAEQPALQTTSLNYSRNLGGRGALNLTATRSVQGGAASRSILLTFTLALAERRALVLGANSGAGAGAPDDELYSSLVQSAPSGPGHGYRIGASSTGNFDAELREQWRRGDLQLQAARNHGVSGASISWNGAATLLGGEFRAARQVAGSFALIDVAGLAGIPVYLDNQLVARTDENGRALLPELLPYQANRVNIEPTELPLDTSIGARTMVLAPRYRSGVIAHFPVERIRGGTFRLITADGNPVPAGATVDFMGKAFPVSYDGVTYVTGFDHGAAGSAQWGESRCGFRLESPPAGDPLPDMGSVVCRTIESGGGQP